MCTSPSKSKGRGDIMKSITIGVNYLTRWFIIPRNRFFNIYLHRFSGSDDDRALHDHPWHSFSIRLRGELKEVYQPKGGPYWAIRTRTPPRFCFRRATFAHRLILVGKKPAWTLFITGPRIREWGFLCPKGWQHWSSMTTREGEQVGGCE